MKKPCCDCNKLLAVCSIDNDECSLNNYKDFIPRKQQINHICLSIKCNYYDEGLLLHCSKNINLYECPDAHLILLKKIYLNE